MSQQTTEYSVTLEFTPNPNTLKFLVNYQFLERGSANFLNESEAKDCPLAQAIFKVAGIQAVLIGTNFVTITKTPEGDWDVVADGVPKTIKSFLKSGSTVFTAGWVPASATNHTTFSEIEQRIQEVLDRDLRPAVAMDGGDITLDRYENGVVYLYLQGACSSCPSSTATLKMGVESRLKDLIPEIKEVVQV